MSDRRKSLGTQFLFKLNLWLIGLEVCACLFALVAGGRASRFAIMVAIFVGISAWKLFFTEAWNSAEKEEEAAGARLSEGESEVSDRLDDLESTISRLNSELEEQAALRAREAEPWRWKRL